MSGRRMAAGDMAVIAFGVVMMLGGAAIALAGPREVMPIHWNIRGEADGWAAREWVGGTVLLLGALLLGAGGALGHYARKAADESRRRGLRTGQLIVLLTLPLVAGLGAAASLSGATTISGALPMIAVSLIFVVIGALLGRVGPNPVVGVRTPWAYKSRLAWDRSNRLAGRLFLILGLAGAALAFVAPQPAGMTGLIIAVLLAALWSVFESWRVWRADPDRQPF